MTVLLDTEFLVNSLFLSTLEIGYFNVVHYKEHTHTLL